jgi:hypothetical protein
MQRSLAPLVTFVLVVSAVSVGATPAAADGLVSVSTTVEPSQPIPEEEFSIQTNITSSADSSSEYRLVEAEVRRGPGENGDLVSEEGFRTTVRPGGTKTVDVGATLNESGTHEVFLRLIFRDNTGDRRVVVQQETIQVIEGHPQADVSTDAALPGDDQTMTVRLSNGLSAPVDNVELTVEGEGVEIRNPRQVTASVASGASESFDFRVTPAAETVQPVNVTIRYSFEGDRRSIEYQLRPDFTPTSDVEHPQVAVDAEAGEAGESRTATVTLSNGLDERIRNVELTVAGERVDIDDPRRVAASVEAGATEQYEFTVTPEVAERLPVEVSLSYTVGDERRGTEYTVEPSFGTADAPAERPQLQLDVEDAVSGASRTVTVTIANGLDNEVRQLDVNVSSSAVTFSSNERVRSALQSGETAELTFTAVAEESGTYPVTVTFDYRDSGVQQRVTRTFDAEFTPPANPGRIRLTDIDAVARGGSLELSATASNVGSERVESVVVGLPDSEDVTGTEYFVGGIDGSDFSSFTISTTVDRNVTSVPVEVTYVVDGVQKTVTTDVPVEQTSLQQAGGSSSGGLPLIPLAAVGVLVIVLGVAYRVRG